MGHILGDINSQPNCKLIADYFLQRDCWVDCRAEDCLWIDGGAHIGWCNTLITLSHDISNPPNYMGLTKRKIIIEKNAFIFGFSILYNCHIKEGAVVAAGSVVRSMTVEPYTMVAGNPAKVIKKFNFDTRKWENV